MATPTRPSGFYWLLMDSFEILDGVPTKNGEEWTVGQWVIEEDDGVFSGRQFWRIIGSDENVSDEYIVTVGYRIGHP
jgi:hypothetical protein